MREGDTKLLFSMLFRRAFLTNRYQFHVTHLDQNSCVFAT